VSDTPISDSTPHNVAELGLLCRKLERDVNDGIDRIKRILAERDTARMQAAQKVDIRKEFRHLLGTDDIEQGVAVVRDMQQRIKRLEQENDAMRADLLLWNEQEAKP